MESKLITKEEFEKRLVDFFAEGRLSQYPRKRRDRQILLKSIVNTLENDKDYTEAEINEAIKTWLDGMFNPSGLDHVTLRRELVDEGYLDRSKNGSRYWVMEPGPSRKRFEDSVDRVDSLQVVLTAKDSLDKTRRVKGEVRKKILDAALECFGTKGYEGASIRDIAEKAGVTLPNIYYYFKDKEGLYQAVLKDTVADLMEILIKLDDPEASFRDRFIALGKAKMRMAGQKNAAIELFIKEMLSSGITSPGLTPSLAGVMQTGLKYLEDMISAAVKKGEIKPINPRIGVLYLISLAFAHGSKFIAQFIKNRETMSDKEVEEFVDLIMKGLEKK
jgi:TetR/AcrR family transcriptional regulator